jgi:hypothetical protein
VCVSVIIKNVLLSNDLFCKNTVNGKFKKNTKKKELPKN